MRDLVAVGSDQPGGAKPAAPRRRPAIRRSEVNPTGRRRRPSLFIASAAGLQRGATAAWFR